MLALALVGHWVSARDASATGQSIGTQDISCMTSLCYTGILYLARRSKYHLSIWPLSKGELIPSLDEYIFFLVSQFLLQVWSRSFAPLPLSLDFSSFFPHPGRRIFPSLPGFTTHACFLKRCAQCCWVNILSTNPFCGLLHSHRQSFAVVCRRKNQNNEPGAHRHLHRQ